jgi:hypothetical protein
MGNSQGLWRDPIWQSIGVVVAVLFGVATLLLGIITILLTRRRKALTYEILSTTPLAAVHDDVGGRLQVVFDGQVVRNVQLALIKFTNSGNVPIRADEYERPVRLIVNENARILTAGITETFPDSLKASIENDQTSALIAPVLLNKGDSITVKLLAADFYGKIFIDTRIVGVSDIKELKISDIESNRSLLLASFIGVAFFVMVYLLLTLFLGKNENVKSFFIGTWIATGGALFFGILRLLFPNVIGRIARKLGLGK